MTTKQQVNLNTYRKKPRALAKTMEEALEPEGDSSSSPGRRC